MSRENVELARSVVGDLQALFDLFHDDITWDSTHYVLPDGVSPLERGVFRGKTAVIDLIKGYVGTWTDYRFEVEEMIDAEDSVVLIVSETARGRGSGVPMEHRYCQVWTFRDRRIVKGGTYASKEEALSALRTD
jgi:ketosteroid isomerase-like protein